MTTLAPDYAWCNKYTDGLTQTPDTLRNLGFQSGDLIIVWQHGAGSGNTSPSPPKINGSSSGFTDGKYDGYSDGCMLNAANGRVQQFSKILVDAELDYPVVVDFSVGYLSGAKIFGILRLRHTNGFDDSRVLNVIADATASYASRSVSSASWSSGVVSFKGSGTLTTNYAVDDLIYIEGCTPTAYNGLYKITGFTTTTVTNDTFTAALVSNPGAYTSGGTMYRTFKLMDSARPCLTTFVFGGTASAASLTSNIDGAASGSLYHRAPYFNATPSSVQYDAQHGHHSNTGHVSAQADFQEYDAGDTPVCWLSNNNVGSAAHAILIIQYQTASIPSYLEGKIPIASKAKADIQAGNIELEGKIPIVSSAKGVLQPLSVTLSGKMPMASFAAAPDGLDEVVGTPFQEIEGKIKNALSAKADIQTGSAPVYLSGKINIIVKAQARLDYGTIVPTVGEQFNLQWGKVGKRSYDYGLDRGVLYLQNGKAVPWNGLTEITEKADISTSPVYYDGRKIGEDMTIGEFSATLKAITYPDEFAELEGFTVMRHGVFVGNQNPEFFDLSWRTKIGNDVDVEAGYKLHILFNVTAIPSDQTIQTLSDSLNIEPLQWELVAVPEEIPGYAPTAHLIFNSLEVDPLLMQNLESILYGNGNAQPNLPSMQDFVYYIENWLRIEIIDNKDGTWTATSKIPGFIVVDSDGSFSINGVNGEMLDSNTYRISNT